MEVGPYRLNWRDRIVLRWVLGLFLAKRNARIFSWLTLLVPLGGVSVGLVTGDNGLVASTLMFLALIFVALPIVARGKPVTLSVETDGIQRSTGHVTAKVKWAGIDRVNKRYGGLYIVGGNCAMMVPSHVAEHQDIDRLADIIRAHLPA